MEIQPKKSLGQNFLKDEKALQKIVKAAELSDKDNVLEIGPGTGVLTIELAKRASQLIAVEKDEKLAVYLELSIKNKELRAASPIKIIRGDILEINLPEILAQNNFSDYKLVANIPYYITGQILRLFLENDFQPKLLVLLVQKEVAERICAKAGQLSILAVSVQYYGEPEIIDVVSRESFQPAPEVDSAILKIVLKRKFSPQDKKFFQLVKIGFSSKRKTLLNNLSVGLKKEKKEIQVALQEEGISLQSRAQELDISQWQALLQRLK